MRWDGILSLLTAALLVAAPTSYTCLLWRSQMASTSGAPLPSRACMRRPTGGSVLKRHGRDLTADAAEGRLDPLIGRQDVMERALQVSGVAPGCGCLEKLKTATGISCQPCAPPPILPHPCLPCPQVLLRRTKNNPVLIGDPGVGKTAVAEGIAQLIVSPAAPPGLAVRALIALDVGSLVSGTQYRGAFEERITVGGCLGGCLHVGLSVGREGRKVMFWVLGPTCAPRPLFPHHPPVPCFIAHSPTAHPTVAVE